MEQHLHAEILRAIADGVPLSEFELTCYPDEKEAWDNMGNGTKWGSWIHNPEAWRVRRKQRTHVFNGFTVPAPMDKEPDDGCVYFLPDLNSSVYFMEYRWFGTGFDLLCFGRGLCFETRVAAISNAKAMLKIDPEAA